MRKESTLLGQSDRELLMLCSAATHQHYKGGLYRYLGPAYDSETGARAMSGNDRLVAYEHVHPHIKQIWLRPEEEWAGKVVVNGEVRRRFRRLGCGEEW